MGGNGYEEGIKGVDLVCGLRKVGVRIGMKYIKTKPLYSGPLLGRDIVIINIHDTSGHKARGRGGVIPCCSSVRSHCSLHVLPPSDGSYTL